MSEVTPVVPTSKYWNADKKKYVITDQFKDAQGFPVGPVQYFEADTLEELLEKKDVAHRNASIKLYETRQANKLGAILEPDPEQPLQTFEAKALTAEERVKLTKMLADPAQAVEAHELLLEAQFGAPVEVIRTKLRNMEMKERVDSIRSEINFFRDDTPEYVDCEANSDKMKKYMAKHSLAYTKKNLKIAYEDLRSDDLLVLQAPQAAVPAVPVPATPAAGAPTPEPTIPVPATPAAPAIPGELEVRAKNSSSGLGRNNSSAVPTNAAPKTPGISIRDINRMSAAEYQKALQDPEFRKQVEALYTKK